MKFAKYAALSAALMLPGLAFGQSYPAPVLKLDNSTVTATGGTTARTLAARAADTINARDYGVVCDATTDDTASLNLFFTKVTAGKQGILPNGTCNFTSLLTFANANASIRGSGPYSTVLSYSGASTTSDLFMVGGQGGTTAEMNLADFRVTSTTTMTSGSAIHVKNVGRSFLQRVIADGQDGSAKLYHGYWFDQVDQVTLDGFDVRAIGDALRVNGTVGAGAKAGLFLSHGKILASGVGVHIGGGFGGFYGSQIDVINNNVNVLVDTALSAEANRELFFGTTFDNDGATTDGYQINDALTTSGLISIGGWQASAGGSGIHVIKWGGGARLLVSAPTIFNNTLDGIRIDDATTNLHISTATHIFSNAGWGVNATVAASNLRPGALPENNTLGTYSANAKIESFSATVGGNGYQRFPNGAVHQWGSLTVTGAANSYITNVITLPIPFSSHFETATAKTNGLPNGASTLIMTDTSAFTLSQFTLNVVANGALASAQPISWDAWGN